MTSPSHSIPISAIQHMLYCPRQCALAYMENLWSENLYTAEGRILHERADEGGKEKRGSKSIFRSIHVHSVKLGIHGIADVVEYIREDDCWFPRPVEYKRGKPKKYHEDEAQLCAQALCLEEMHGITIASGDLFYGEVRRRTEVEINSSLRNLTVSTISDIKRMFASGKTPPAVFSRKCLKCSLQDACMPRSARLARGVQSWNDRHFRELLTD